MGKTFRTQERLEALNIKDRENPARLSALWNKFLGWWRAGRKDSAQEHQGTDSGAP